MVAANSDDAEHLSVCRLCGAYCGIRIEVRGDQVTRVRGDQDHPDSRGYTCTKGRALPALHHDPDRLDHPLLDGVPVEWDRCIDDLADRLGEVRAAHGNASVAAYTGMGSFGDRPGGVAFAQLVAGLDTPQVYTAASVDIFPLWKATELVTGFPREINPLWEPEDSPPLCLVFGQNIVVAHGYATGMLSDPIRRIQGFLRDGGEMWVLDPRRTETAALATRHLAVGPDSDVAILGWLVHSLLVSGHDADELDGWCDPADVATLRDHLAPFTLELACRRSGIDADTLTELLDAIRRAGKVACLSGSGLNFGRHGVVAEWLRWVLMIITGSVDTPGGVKCMRGVVGPLDERDHWDPAPPQGRVEPGPASRPELRRWMGEYPSVSLVDEIEAGHVRALVVFGGNPLTAFPDPERTAAALASLDVLAVAEILHKDLTAMATHVLACADIIEHADVVVRERSAYVPRVVAPRAQRRPAWWIFARLGRAMGIDVLDGIDIDRAGDDDVLRAVVTGSGAAEVFAAGPRGVAAERRDGWVHEKVLAGRTWRIAPPILVERLSEVLAAEPDHGLRLISGRHPARMNSIAYRTGPDRVTADAGFVAVHPDDAAQRGIADRSRVEVASAAGVARLEVRCDERMRPGTVSITHGMGDANVNALVSADTFVDPISGQPAMSGVAVELRPVNADVDR